MLKRKYAVYVMKTCVFTGHRPKGLGYPESDERCDKETMLQTHYTPDCLRKRNRYMVDRADIVLAVWNGSPSGTGQTVWYARETGKPVWILRPDTLEVQ